MSIIKIIFLQVSRTHVFVFCFLQHGFDIDSYREMRVQWYPNVQCILAQKYLMKPERLGLWNPKSSGIEKRRVYREICNCVPLSVYSSFIHNDPNWKHWYTQHRMSSEYYAEWKKPDSKAYIWYDFTCRLGRKNKCNLYWQETYQWLPAARDLEALTRKNFFRTMKMSYILMCLVVTCMYKFVKAH